MELIRVSHVGLRICSLNIGDVPLCLIWNAMLVPGHAHVVEKVVFVVSTKHIDYISVLNIIVL